MDPFSSAQDRQAPPASFIEGEDDKHTDSFLLSKSFGLAPQMNILKGANSSALYNTKRVHDITILWKEDSPPNPNLFWFSQSPPPTLPSSVHSNS
jgi:hypothetical protein